MKQLTPFPNEDLFIIKWKIAFFVLCMTLAIGMFWGADSLSSQASRALSLAQGELYSARSAVEQIEEEEATIVEYIDRYQELSDRGIVEAEDRLLFLEKMAELRSQFDLFPIALNIEEQVGLRLQYAPGETEPGGPIDLKTSSVSLSLPLLHEEDLTRLMDSLLNDDGLFQTRECRISSLNRSTESFVSLGQHLSANCELHWHTFDLNPSTEVVI